MILIENFECNRKEAESVVEMALEMEDDGIWQEFFSESLSPQLLKQIINDFPSYGTLSYRWNWCAGLQGSFEYLEGYRI
ncbi:hypothetical protein [Halalkalicoccus subterraneus]|uniref:hypothetical protein n=1 Tax=Halalkalicoccus subterraneus TaxID=2675002 RepID=UPI0013CE7976|nr:hypothetical protein [Halalkalicoccus subterraneus]